MRRTITVILITLNVDAAVMADESLYSRTFVGSSVPTGNESIEESAESTEEQQPRIPAFGVPTLGGMQFWGDVEFFQGWKIQQNVLSRHYRLLSPTAARFASGTLEQCQSMLRAIAKRDQLPEHRNKAVIILHGIGRSSKSFSTMHSALSSAGYLVVPFEYPSTRVLLEQSSDYLQSVIASLKGSESIDFVVHSMGGLVVRMWLTRHKHDPRIRRLVMLGTPNKGAEMADILRSNAFYSLVYGPAGQQLTTGEHGVSNILPVPPFEFGVIAGGKGDDRGFNPLIKGDDDGTVAVASARLEGAADYLRVPRLHSFLMNDAEVIAATKCFLEHGRFGRDRKPEPVIHNDSRTEPPVSSANQVCNTPKKDTAH
ncbi:MAG: hypothetical protein R3C20_07100 [Planctomycetaceae bacterium]